MFSWIITIIVSTNFKYDLLVYINIFVCNIVYVYNIIVRTTDTLREN